MIDLLTYGKELTHRLEQINDARRCTFCAFCLRILFEDTIDYIKCNYGQTAYQLLLDVYDTLRARASSTYILEANELDMLENKITPFCEVDMDDMNVNDYRQQSNVINLFNSALLAIDFLRTLQASAAARLGVDVLERVEHDIDFGPEMDIDAARGVREDPRFTKELARQADIISQLEKGDDIDDAFMAI